MKIRDAHLMNDFFVNMSLTKEEATLLDDYLFRKLVRLKESGLEDAKCFIVLSSIRRKLKEAMK